MRYFNDNVITNMHSPDVFLILSRAPYNPNNTLSSIIFKK